MLAKRDFQTYIETGEAFMKVSPANKLNFYGDLLQASPSISIDGNSPDVMRHIINKIPPDKYNKILDIGVANGYETQILKDFGYSPVGIIRGRANVEWAVKNYPGITFIDCDMHDLPFLGDSFDAIYTNQVYEHAFAPFIFLLECWSVLRVGGILFVCIPCFEERHTKNSPGTMEAQWISHHHPSLFPGAVNRQMFEKTGFEIMLETPNSDMFLLKKLPGEYLHPDVLTAVKKRNRIASGLPV